MWHRRQDRDRPTGAAWVAGTSGAGGVPLGGAARHQAPRRAKGTARSIVPPGAASRRETICPDTIAPARPDCTPARRPGTATRAASAAGAVGLLAALLVCATPAFAAPPATESAAPCPVTGETSASATSPAPVAGAWVSAAWTEAGALALSDGRRLVPEGIALPSRLSADAQMAQAAARAGSAALDGCAVRLADGPTDRHGRRAAAAVARCPGASASEDLAVVLLRAGAGYARPAAGDAACRAERMAAEDAARTARRGLWAATGAIAPANDEAAMAIHAGLFTVAEGRVLAAGGTRERIYLNFGASWRQDFTVMIAREDFATILGDSLDPALLRGTLMRVRGVVRTDGGPAITVRQAGEISRLSDAGASRRRRGSE